MVALFYLPLLPLVVPITLAGSLITYWVDKILLLRRHCRPDPIGQEFSQFYLSVAPWILILYSFSNWFWVFRISPSHENPISAILVFLLLIVQLFPFRALLFMVMREKKENTKEYQKPQEFENEYQRSNPVYKDKITLDYFQKGERSEQNVEDIFRSIMSYSKDHESLRAKVNSHNLLGQKADRFFNMIKKEERSVGHVLDLVRQNTFISDLFKQPRIKATSSPLDHIFTHLNLNSEQKDLIARQNQSSSLIIEEQGLKDEESKTSIIQEKKQQNEGNMNVLNELGLLLDNEEKNDQRKTQEEEQRGDNSNIHLREQGKDQKQQNIDVFSQLGNLLVNEEKIEQKVDQEEKEATVMSRETSQKQEEEPNMFDLLNQIAQGGIIEEKGKIEEDQGEQREQDENKGQERTNQSGFIFEDSRYTERQDL